MTLRYVFAVFLSTCGSLFLASLTAFVFRLMQAAGSTATRERATTLGALAADAIRYTAEVSAAFEKRSGVPLTGVQKLGMAVEYMLRQTRLSREEAADAIHANLAIAGEGATLPAIKVTTTTVTTPVS